MKKLGKLSKILTLGVTVLMAVSLFAGCGDEKKSADTGKSSNVAEDIAAIKKRGVLRIGVKNVTKGFGYQDPAWNHQPLLSCFHLPSHFFSQYPLLFSQLPLIYSLFAYPPLLN